MKKTLWGMALLASAITAGVGCSNSGSSAAPSSGGPSSTTISGTLSTSRASNVSQGAGNSAFAVTLSDLEIYGICFSTPPAIATANVGSDGKFSITLTCAPGNAVSGVFRTKTDGVEVGQIKFVDSSKKDINGNNKETTTVTLTGDTDFGAISIDSSGNVKIPVSQIASTVGNSTVAASTAFDFTGVWQIAPYDGTLPTGYVTSNPSGSQEKGPPTDFKLSILRYVGKEFTPATDGSCSVNDTTGVGTCAGTTSDTDAYAIQLWMGDATTDGMSGVKACGYKSNFTVAEAQKHAHIDLSSASTSIAGNAMSFARVTFAAPSGYGGDTCTGQEGVLNCNRPWMKTGATASWNVQDCTQVTKTVSSTNYVFGSCKIDNGNGVKYSAHLMSGGGGCVDSAGKALRVDNWSTITGTCTSSNHPVTGVTTNSCTYTGEPYTGAGSQTFTCSHVGGLFDDANLSTPANAQAYGQYDGSDYVTIVNAGSQCKTISAANEIHRLRCYAQSYQGGGGDMDCSQRFMLNWDATAPANFEVANNRHKPASQFITNIATYSPDGTTVFANDEEEGKATVWNNGTQQICSFVRTSKIALKKISDTKLLWDMTESGRLISTDAACRAAMNDVDSNGKCKQNSPYQWLCEEVSPARYLFYTNKQ